MKYLIVWEMEQYAHTRHNIGFDVGLLTKHGGHRVDRHAYVTDVRWKGKNFLCICPTTYMNLSGKAVKYSSTRKN
jgi:PTH1 family peptidyl-tRNA hydrolase